MAFYKSHLWYNFVFFFGMFSWPLYRKVFYTYLHKNKFFHCAALHHTEKIHFSLMRVKRVSETFLYSCLRPCDLAVRSSMSVASRSNSPSTTIVEKQLGEYLCYFEKNTILTIALFLWFFSCAFLKRKNKNIEYKHEYASSRSSDGLTPNLSHAPCVSMCLSL